MTLPRDESVASTATLGFSEAPPSRGRWRRPVRSEWPLLAVAAVAAAAVLLPVGGLVYFALRGSGDLWPHLLANVLPPAIRTTAGLLVGVGLFTTLIGVGTAWIVAMYRFPGRRLFESALLLPLAVPTYIVAYAYLDVMHPVGPVQSALRQFLGIANPRDLWFPEIRSLEGAVFLLAFVLYPYVYLPVRALFVMQSASLLEAARTLGSSRRRAFFRVALPLARPAIAIGLSLALLEALNDIGASEFLGVRTLTVAIYTTWVTRSSIEGAAQIALVMLAFVFLLILMERHGRRRQRYAGQAQKAAPPHPARLHGLRAAGAVLACLLPIVAGFAVPAAYLIGAAWTRVAKSGVPAELPLWIANSLGFALAATLVAAALGLVLAYAARMVRHPAGAALVRVAGIGYALPGTVLAVGLLVPMGAFDNLVDAASRQLFGIGTGLLLLGSGAGLVFAYVIRFLTIPIGGTEAGLAKVSPSIDMAARSLGSRPARTLARIHLPMVAPAVAAAALLVFVDCMKELPATLLLRPFNFETLATQLYGEAARGTYEAGAVSALAIVIAGVLPVVLLSWTGQGGRPPRRQGARGSSPASAGLAKPGTA